MSDLKGNERYQYVQNTFTRIAKNYDLLNRLMTFGFDKGWRKEAIALLNLENDQAVLDIGCGTGDFAIEMKEKYPDLMVIAADFTPEMVRVGKKRKQPQGINWVIADAQHLPFKKESFESIVSGYLFRNVPDVDKAILEQYRVCKNEGNFVTLDTTPPSKNILLPFINFHLHVIIPTLGKLIAGETDAYNYLPDSTEKFLSADKLAAKIRNGGFTTVQFTKKMFATMAIHWGKKK